MKSIIVLILSCFCVITVHGMDFFYLPTFNSLKNARQYWENMKISVQQGNKLQTLRSIYTSSVKQKDQQTKHRDLLIVKSLLKIVKSVDLEENTFVIDPMVAYGPLGYALSQIQSKDLAIEEKIFFETFKQLLNDNVELQDFENFEKKLNMQSVRAYLKNIKSQPNLQIDSFMIGTATGILLSSAALALKYWLKNKPLAITHCYIE